MEWSSWWEGGKAMARKTEIEVNEVRDPTNRYPDESRASRMMTPFEEMDRMFDLLSPRGWLRPFQWDVPRGLDWITDSRYPRVDILDHEAEILVRVEIPGVKKEDIDVSLIDNTLCIRGRSREESEERHGNFFRREISQGTFDRTLILPGAVDAEHAKATFKDGMLELNLPKLEQSKRHSLKIE